MRLLANWLTALTLVAISVLPAWAEVDDKEPSFASLWMFGIAVVAGAYILGRVKFWLPLFMWPVGILWAIALLQEINDPQVGPAIANELAASYVIQSYLSAGVALLAPPAFVLWFRRPLRASVAKKE